MLVLGTARPGVVASVLVRAGEHVERGQALLRLEDEDARTAVTIASGHLRQARAQARLVDVRLTAARKRARRLLEAANAGADTGQNADDAAGRVRQLKAEKAAAEAAVHIAGGRLDQARYALAQHTLKAPLAADVVASAVQPGEAVSPQSGALFTLLPDTPRVIVAEVSSDFVDAVHAGMRAQIVLDNDAATEVGSARVVRVGKVFGPSTLEEDPALRANTRAVTCVLHFEKPSALRVGRRVLVRIFRDTDVRQGARAVAGDGGNRP